jgi:hypothetical protein
MKIIIPPTGHNQASLQTGLNSNTKLLILMFAKPKVRILIAPPNKLFLKFLIVNIILLLLTLTLFLAQLADDGVQHVIVDLHDVVGVVEGVGLGMGCVGPTLHVVLDHAAFSLLDLLHCGLELLGLLLEQLYFLF